MSHGGGAYGGAEPLDSPFSHGGWWAPGRAVTVALATDGTPAQVIGGALPLPLLAPPGPTEPGAATKPWGAALAAPETEAGLPPAFAALAGLAALDNPPVLVAVHGGTPLTRVLLSEQARMHEQIPALVVAGGSADEAAFRDEALTAVLSGRADLVGRPAPAPGDTAATPSAGSSAPSAGSPG
jgi:salicyloyl-CoA 5-hydroxylase